MSLKPYPTILNSDLYLKTWKDTIYNDMNAYLYSISKFKELTDKGKIQRSIGRDDSLVYQELFYYECLIDYFINARETLFKSGITDYTTEKLTYNFSCIRSTLFCRYGSNETLNIFDNLYIISGLSKDILDGLDYMIFDPNSLGSELLTNGNFSSITGGYINNWFDRQFGVDLILTDTNISAGQFTYSSTLIIGSDTILTIGNAYRLQIDIISIITSLTIEYQDGSGSIVVFTATGTNLIFDFVATSTKLSFHANGVVTINNISIKKITSDSNNNDFIII